MNKPFAYELLFEAAEEDDYGALSTLQLLKDSGEMEKFMNDHKDMV